MAPPSIEPIAALFRRLGRALERLVLGVLDNPGPDPMAELEEAEGMAREAGEEAQETIREWIEDEAPRYYFEGVVEAGGDTGNLSSEAEDARDFALEQLASTLLDGASSMERDAVSQVRRLTRARLDSAAAGGVRKEARELADEIRERGIKVVDGAGRKQDPAYFAERAPRTMTGELQNSGVIQAARQIDAPGVRVRDGGHPDPDDGRADQHCIDIDGEAWGLEYAAQHLLAHVNCRRAFSSLSPSFDGELDRE